MGEEMEGKSYELPEDITTLGGMVSWADKDAEWHTEVFEFLADARYAFREHVLAGDVAYLARLVEHVIEFVRSFALMRTSANLSANAALLGTPSCCFISAVLLPPNNASSPFDLMIANPLESTPRLNAIPESCFSESDSEWRACKR